MKSKITFYSLKKPARWFVLLIAFVFAAGMGYSQVAINTDNSLPDASAMLDVKSTSKGLLIPRVSSTSNVSSPATGLLVYQTGGTAGFYYYNGTQWIKLSTGATSEDWSITGNSGTNSSINFSIATG